MNSLQSNNFRSVSRRRLQAGFSLVEVLIAMGIFAVGFVAVAAMFPAGAMLQRETVAQVEAQLVSRNAAAIVRSSTMTFAADGSNNADLKEDSGSINLEPFATATGVSAKVKTRWKLGDRGYPTAQAKTKDRKYYWVPFLRRNVKTSADKAKDRADWSIVVFVLRREIGYDYGFTAPGYTYTVPTGTWANKTPSPVDDGPTVPKVIGVVPSAASGSRFTFNNRLFPAQTPAGLPDQVRPGDFVADNNGVVYNVTDADATGCTIAGGIPPLKSGASPMLWYAPPPGPGTTSPCVRILLLSGIVEDAVP